MPLQFIIDGYNIIYHPLFAKNHKKTFKDVRAALLEFIKSKMLCGSPKNGLTVVFDGYSNEVELRSLYRDKAAKVVFSGDVSADDRIKELLESSKDIKNIIVVSDDREIRFFVKSLKGKCISVEEFIGKGANAGATKDRDVAKDVLSYSQVHRINEELKKIWLEKG